MSEDWASLAAISNDYLDTRYYSAIETYRKSGSLLNELGVAAALEGDFQKASSLFEQAIEVEPGNIEMTVDRLEAQMLEAASNMEFERAAELRDRMKELQGRMLMTGIPTRTSSTTGSGKGRKKGRRGKKT